MKLLRSSSLLLVFFSLNVFILKKNIKKSIQPNNLNFLNKIEKTFISRGVLENKINHILKLHLIT
jgi:hypothetical protein